jgi:hypothetical protein
MFNKNYSWSICTAKNMYKIFGCDYFSKYFLFKNASKWSKNTKKIEIKK